MWDLIVSVPDHCLSFYFSYAIKRKIKRAICHKEKNKKAYMP